MYISGKQHIFSQTIMDAAVLNLVIAGASGVTRLVLNQKVSAAPDMLNPYFWATTILFSALQVLFTMVIFHRAWRQLDHIRRLIPKDDYGEMAKLQEEIMPESVSRLSTYSIKQLLDVWGAILIGVKIIYDIFTIIYRFFIQRLYVQFDMNNTSSAQEFITLYNTTHGFKYIGMLIAITLGILITGIFLNDRNLKAAALLLSVLFVLSATIMQMWTIHVAGRSVNIVWSSVIFQMLQTVGLLGFSFYIRMRYKGI